MFSVDLKSRTPIYEQLKNSALELIMHGVLKVDDPVPSVRSLASQLGVNPNTIQKAYQEMEREGIIYSLPGKGSFVSDKIKSNPMLLNDSIEKLRTAIYQARLYGVEEETAIAVVKHVYERGISNES